MTAGVIQRPSGPKVLFIVGSGRSGSTILDQALGEVSRYCSVGELHTLWTHGLRGGDVCGCGIPVVDCPFWSRVVEVVQRSVGTVDPISTQTLVDRFIRMRPRSLARLRMLGPKTRRAGPMIAYGRLLGAVYRAIAEIGQADVVVDSTKVPSHALVAARFTGLDVYVVHLVRDPRAVAYSWLTNPDAGNRRLTSGAAFRGLGSVRGTVQWAGRTVATELLVRPVLNRRYLRLRYEDLATDPARSIDRIIQLLSPREDVRSPITAGNVNLSENHILAGNRSKFQRGEMEIRYDGRWTSHLPRHVYAVTTMLALPLLPFYGYPIRRARSAQTVDTTSPA